MNTQPDATQQQEVSTEPQRVALELMSAELVHKLNIMIAEQEERVRIFAEQHHSQSPFPEQGHATLLPEQPITPQAPEAAPEEPTSRPKKAIVAKFKSIARPSIPAVPSAVDSHSDRPVDKKPFPGFPQPARQASPAKEESSIGVGTIVFGIVAIIFLLRACS